MKKIFFSDLIDNKIDIINNPNYTFNLTIKYLKRLFSKYNEKKDEIFNSIKCF